MSNDLTPIRDLQHNLEDALDLLQDYADAQLPDSLLDPLPSLLEQCEALCQTAPEVAPLRSVHHFACTGGTLICKCLATMPNTTLLSEIDPLSLMQVGPDKQRQFMPTDLIYGARVALRPIDDTVAQAMFHAALQALHDELGTLGRHLILRDHAHSQFCSDTAPHQRPTLHDLMTEAGTVRAVVTVRHPLDSFLSLNANNWRHFTPFTLEDYARRYHAFLDCHASLALYRYEDFVRDPETVLRDICADLALTYVPGSESLLQVVSISGDSGRSASRIGSRPRRNIPQEINGQIAHSPQYHALCARLGYEGVPEATS